MASSLEANKTAEVTTESKNVTKAEPAANITAAVAPKDDPLIKALSKPVPIEPQEAIVLEHEISKNQKKLSHLKVRNFDELEAEEQIISAYEGRAPRWPKVLITEELNQVEGEKSDLQAKIKGDETRLDEIWPLEYRIAAKE